MQDHSRHAHRTEESNNQDILFDKQDEIHCLTGRFVDVRRLLAGQTQHSQNILRWGASSKR